MSTGSAVSEQVQPVNVLCMKWGTLYGPEYVNHLYSGVRRHLARPFRFICFTDDANGLLPEVETQTLPDIGAPDAVDTRWRKVALFKQALGGLTGTALFLDLDLVVVDALDPLFEQPGEVCMLRDADLFPDRLLRRLRPQRRRFYQQVGNTSVFRFTIGAHADIVSRFLEQNDAIVGGYRNEQEFVSDHLREQGRLHFYPRTWCVSFKHDCVPSGFSSYLRNPVIPVGARIVVFAGRIKMHDVIDGRASRLHRRVGPTPWLAEHWRDGL